MNKGPLDAIAVNLDVANALYRLAASAHVEILGSMLDLRGRRVFLPAARGL